MNDIYKILCEANETEMFVPDTQWLATNYEKMNNLLFNGELGRCNFYVFTKGKGSSYKHLGHFGMAAHDIMYNKRTRQMFVSDYWGEKELVNKDNFYNICKPYIELNGNYKWTEKAALTTLVHEMCHYYTYMNGIYPKQSHGVEFKQIAAYVSSKSNDFFTIKRLSGAEQVGEMELDDKVKAGIENRMNTRMTNMVPVIIFRKDGQVRLMNAVNARTAAEIVATEETIGKYKYAVVSMSKELKNEIIGQGYRQFSKKYGTYYDITNSNIPEMIESGKFKVAVVLGQKEEKSEGDAGMMDKKAEVDSVCGEGNGEVRYPLFRIKLVGGSTFELRNVTKDEVKEKLRERFPKWSDATIDNTANNDNYYGG